MGCRRNLGMHTLDKSAEERKISFSIMSVFVVLMVQYLALYLLVYIDPNMVKAISRGFVFFSFFVSFTHVVRRQGHFLAIFYICFLLVLGFNFLIFPENYVHLREVAVYLAVVCLPLFFYTYSVSHIATFKRIFISASRIIFFFGSLLFILSILNTIDIGYYSMSFSYYMLLPAISYMDKFFDRGEFRFLGLSLLAIGMIVTKGARGPLLCIFVFVALSLMLFYRSQKNSVLLVQIVILVLGIMIAFSKSFMHIFVQIFNYFGLSGRSLILMSQNGLNLTGRSEIYTVIWEQIKQNPCFGIGLAGDRNVLGGSYAHSIVLELFLGFGVPIGAFLLIFIIVLTLLGFSYRSNFSRVLLIWFCIGFVPLFVSSSYLISMPFWVYLGLLLKSFRIETRNDPRN